MAKTFTAQNFQAEVLKSEKPVLVDFWATWCGPCKCQAPIIDQLAEEGYCVGKVNVDEEPMLAQQFQIMSIPTMIIFRDGREIERLVGLNSRETLKQALDE